MWHFKGKTMQYATQKTTHKKEIKKMKQKKK